MAAGESRVISAGPTRFPYPLSDDYKRRVPHTTRYPEEMTQCCGSKSEKGMVHKAGAQQVFRKYGHPYIFFKRVPHTTQQLSGL